MAEHVSYPEEECFNVYWKIKNFSYCCGKIESSEFYVSTNLYCLRLELKPLNIRCWLDQLSYYGSDLTSKLQISFLTCDGSPEESISGDEDINLQVPKNVIFGSRRNAFLPEDTLTVRFQSLADFERGKVVIQSIIGVKRKYFLWPLKDFNKFNSVANKSLERSEAYGNIGLNFKSTGSNNPTEQFGFEICRTGGERCYCVLKIQILGVDGKAINEVSDEFALDKDKNTKTKVFPLIIKKSKLLAYENLLLSNDTLSLKCEFAVSLGKVSDQTAVVSYCEDVILLLKESVDFSMIFKEKNDSGSVTDLQTDLKSLLEKGTLHDASLQIGTEVIPVHKTILGARSPVFRAMFAKDMKEAISNTAVIEDLEVETVRGLLLYIYTDTINDCKWESMKRLYVASDKYEVLNLKKKCVSFLKANLSVSNACDAVVLSDLHQDKDLKRATIDFISEYDSEVFESEEWEELEKNHPSQALKIMRDIHRKSRIRLN